MTDPSINPATSGGENTALVDRLRQEISRHGSLTFDRFMEAALYEPGLGYYVTRGDASTGKPDAMADFQTSPQVHRIFGLLIARQLELVWQALDCPNPFVIVELGAGRGELAVQIVEAFADSLPNLRLAYHAADLRPRSAWSATYKSIRRWDNLAEISESGLLAHCVISNEFFDAVPVHRVTWLNGRLREILVDWGVRGFVERYGPPTDPRLIDWIASFGSAPVEGWVGEICLRLPTIVEQIGRLIERGVVLTIDYGFETEYPGQFSPSGGTVVAYYRHQWNDDILARVGEQDLTSHVDFSALIRLGKAHGLIRAGLTNQRDFLLALDLATVAPRLTAQERTAAGRWQAHLSISELLRKDGLGRLKVLAQQKQVPAFRLSEVP